MVKITIIIMIATVMSRVVGFFREITVGNVLGTTNIADAYLVAISVPNIVFANIAGAIATTFVPMYVRQREGEGAEKALCFTNNLMNIVLFISVLLSVACVIFAEPILSLFAYGFDDTTLSLTVSISRVVFFMIIFLGVDSILTGYLQSNGSFIMAAVMGIPNSILVISSLYLYGSYGIMGVAYATLLGMAAQFLLLLLNSVYLGFKFKPVLRLRDETIKNILILAIPVFIGSAIGQINAMVDRMLASGLESGSIAALNYANKLNTFIFGITSAAIATVIYPLLSKLNFQNNNDAYKDLLVKSFNTVTILLLPISVGACILCKPTVTLLFERGVFDERSTELTASALLYYSLGMAFYGYRDVLSRAFFSMQDTKGPMINGFIAVAINIILNVILVRFMAHRGLALATSISAFASTIILTVMLRKKMGSIGGRRILKTFGKTILSVTAMGVVVWFSYDYTQNIFSDGNFLLDSILYIAIVGVGAAVYLALLWIFKVEELKWFIEKLHVKNRILN